MRSTYVDSVIPDSLLKVARVVEHYGFQGVEYEAVRGFFDHYGIEFPSTPILAPEFSNPLFLKTMCDGLRDTDTRRLPRGMQGISSVFGMYLDGVNSRLAGRIDYDPADNHVRETLEGIADWMIETGPAGPTVHGREENRGLRSA